MRRSTGLVVMLLVLAGCASRPGYNPPPERRGAERCPLNEVWVCTNRYPSRVDSEDDVPMICRCEDLRMMR